MRSLVLVPAHGDAVLSSALLENLEAMEKLEEPDGGDARIDTLELTML